MMFAIYSQIVLEKNVKNIHRERTNNKAKEANLSNKKE